LNSYVLRRGRNRGEADGVLFVRGVLLETRRPQANPYLRDPLATLISMSPLRDGEQADILGYLGMIQVVEHGEFCHTVSRRYSFLAGFRI
jgi:hypothetical protein